MPIFIHPSAEVSPCAQLADGVRVYNQVHIRENAVVGEHTILGKDCYIDQGVRVGARCKIQNGVYLYHGVVVEDGVFLGPRVTTTNDLHPRAIFPDGNMRGPNDFRVVPTNIGYGASIGAGAILLCGISIGRFAMVAAGSVVTKDVPDFALVRGHPARLVGAVCACGAKIVGKPKHCAHCGEVLSSAALSLSLFP
jgi:acetyltransferase-like isoleucine patch superfamily enzyme